MSAGKANVLQWCCALEKHKKLGFHYHLVIKLDRNHRWLKSKEHLLRQYGISVHYLSSHENCFSAWCYVTKEDKYYKQSTGHPDLRNRSEPRTSAAALRCNENDGDDELADGSDDEQPFRLKNKKKKKLSAFDVAQIVTEKGLKTMQELQ